MILKAFSVTEAAADSVYWCFSCLLGMVHRARTETQSKSCASSCILQVALTIRTLGSTGNTRPCCQWFDELLGEDFRNELAKHQQKCNGTHKQSHWAIK
eukprot:181675-Amphidinium_carterae.1